jgi:hypothetical protein
MGHAFAFHVKSNLDKEKLQYDVDYHLYIRIIEGWRMLAGIYWLDTGCYFRS